MSKHVLHSELSAIIERDEERYVGYCPEMTGANGPGKNVGKWIYQRGGQSIVLDFANGFFQSWRR